MACAPRTAVRDHVLFTVAWRANLSHRHDHYGPLHRSHVDLDLEHSNQSLRRGVELAKNPTPQTPPVTPTRLPHITLLIPLFRETEIARHLLARLRDLDYPQELLDVGLVTESDDQLTRDALGKTVLPTWMRPIIVPKGTLRTKPRALNFALDFARGSIIGVYDAEDAPERDQLRTVATQFANSGP